MIIIEGPDAAGKTTLAYLLAEALSTDVYEGEGPPRFLGDIPQRLTRYARLPPHTICDRHPCVSEDMYSRAFYRPTELTDEDMAHFYDADHLIIYCDPLPTSRHVVKPHDTQEHLDGLERHGPHLLTLYQEWALRRAHAIYRIGDDVSRIVNFAHSYVEDIAAFHRRFGIQYDGPPRELPPDLRRFRIIFMAEELCEYAGVSDAVKQTIQSVLAPGNPANDPPLEDQFDALIDLAYVLLGTAHLHGFPFQAGWSRVHAANMRKVRAQSADDSKRGHPTDVVKPPGWRPAPLGDLLRPEMQI